MESTLTSQRRIFNRNMSPRVVYYSLIYYFALFQVNKTSGPLNGHEWFRIFKQILRYTFWYFYVDIFLHFTYFSAFHKHSAIFDKLAPQDYG